MNINEKTKGWLNFMLIFAIIALTVVVLLYPEYLGNTYSLKSLEEAQGKIVAIENELIRNEKNIETLIKERETSKVRAERTAEEANALRKDFDEKSLEYHIPSLLITLEQGALDIKISEKNFFIEYDQIKSSSDGEVDAVPGELSEKQPGQTPEQSPALTPEDDKKDELVEEKIVGEEKEEEPSPDIPSMYDEDITKGDPTSATAFETVPQIPGVTVTTIPLKLIGVTYAQAREYVEFLDNLDFVEPSFIDLYSNGEQTSLVVLIHVFHKEGGVEDGRQ